MADGALRSGKFIVEDEDEMEFDSEDDDIANEEVSSFWVVLSHILILKFDLFLAYDYNSGF